MTKQLHLSKRHHQQIKALVHELLPSVEVWVYGSRVNGRSHDGSDLDLALRGQGLKQIPMEQLVAFNEAIQDSNIPFLVEASDWVRIPIRFQQEIERTQVTLVPATVNTK
ncbi:MAG: nucleotidyltransferase domain-containing protein [Aestuariivita sp.]|nr:nucleotidyltransferase domain-containing protein [Aestuariivita sp.]